MKIKTERSENNNPKKAPVFAFGYAAAWPVFAFGYAAAGKGAEAEGRRAEDRVPVPVF